MSFKTFVLELDWIGRIVLFVAGVCALLFFTFIIWGTWTGDIKTTWGALVMNVAAWIVSCVTDLWSLLSWKVVLIGFLVWILIYIAITLSDIKSILSSILQNLRK